MPTQAPRKGNISIHSPRMGRDLPAPVVTADDENISIHSPRMGRDTLPTGSAPSAGRFQSTLPAWGETYWHKWIYNARDKFQSTLPAWGETGAGGSGIVIIRFQSTLPAWGETVDTNQLNSSRLFQSTLPAWGETAQVATTAFFGLFQSTLPAWGETRPLYRVTCKGDFNPLSPHGERPRRASWATQQAISIHSPRMGRDA